MTNDRPMVPSAADASSDKDANVPERAYLRHRAFQELGFAIGARDPSAKVSHDQMARAYCVRCRAIRDPAECAVCALQPVCKRIADQARE
ncbi:hypothetical protein [Sphingomonas melonis]|uniref:hypothetical protein n=1 Tax=Sphingomonas melonis TaxID=152682 RepID=UPI00369C6E67